MPLQYFTEMKTVMVLSLPLTKPLNTVNKPYHNNLRFGRFQMEAFSYQNKVRLCSAIFTALIFLDIIAFFDTLSPILSFRKQQNGSSDLRELSHDIERENQTKSYESEELVEGELVHNVALLLVELLGLAILLVGCQTHFCSSACKPNPPFHHILLSSYLHIH